MPRLLRDDKPGILPQSPNGARKTKGSGPHNTAL